MNKVKRKILGKKGWKVGSADEFLGLTPPRKDWLK